MQTPSDISAWPPPSLPCFSCGELLVRATPKCPVCQMDQSPQARDRAAALAGDWYVLGKRGRSSFGVNINVILQRIAQGRIAPTTVLRGPATRGEWAMAGAIPGLARLVGLCHVCGSKVDPAAVWCACGEKIDEIPARPPEQSPAAKFDGSDSLGGFQKFLLGEASGTHGGIKSGSHPAVARDPTASRPAVAAAPRPIERSGIPPMVLVAGAALIGALLAFGLGMLFSRMTKNTTAQTRDSQQSPVAGAPQHGSPQAMN